MRATKSANKSVRDSIKRRCLLDQVCALLESGNTQRGEAPDDQKCQAKVDQGNGRPAGNVNFVIHQNDQGIEQIGEEGGHDNHADQRLEAPDEQANRISTVMTIISLAARGHGGEDIVGVGDGSDGNWLMVHLLTES